MSAKLKVHEDKIEFEGFEYLDKVVTFWLREEDFVIFNKTHLEGENNKIVVSRDENGNVTDEKLAQTILSRYGKKSNEFFMDYGCALNLDILYYQVQDETEK